MFSLSEQNIRTKISSLKTHSESLFAWRFSDVIFSSLRAGDFQAIRQIRNTNTAEHAEERLGRSTKGETHKKSVGRERGELIAHLWDLCVSLWLTSPEPNRNSSNRILSRRIFTTSKQLRFELRPNEDIKMPKNVQPNMQPNGYIVIGSKRKQTPHHQVRWFLKHIQVKNILKLVFFFLPRAKTTKRRRETLPKRKSK